MCENTARRLIHHLKTKSKLSIEINICVDFPFFLYKYNNVPKIVIFSPLEHVNVLLFE